MKEDDEPISIAAPPRPRKLDCVILLLLAPLIYMANIAIFALIAAAEAMLRAVDLPASLAVVMGVGTWALLLGAGLLLLHAHQTRWRAATLDERAVIIGMIDPPRGIVVPYEKISAFRCNAAGVVLVLRGKPWTRWLGPLVACDGSLMHRVIVRLEAHGVRRLDG